MTRAKRAPLKPLSVSEAAELLNREVFMARKLKAHGCDVFAGSSDTASRKACFRRVITERGLDCAIIGKGTDGKCVTYGQAFERTYGEPLTSKRKRPSDSTEPAAQTGNLPTNDNPQEDLP